MVMQGVKNSSEGERGGRGFDRETQPKTPNNKQCRCRSTVARKNSLERPKPRKKPREEPGYVGWPVLFWLCWVEI